MKNLILFLLLVCIFFSNCFSQNIYLAVHLKDKEYKARKPKKIHELWRINHNDTLSFMQRVEKTLDSAGNLKLEERFDNTGKMIIKLLYSYNDDHLLTSVKFESWVRFYELMFIDYNYYSNQALHSILERNSKGLVINSYFYLPNDRGYPNKIYQLDSIGRYALIETGTYEFENNQVITKQYEYDGTTVLLTDTLSIDTNKDCLAPKGKRVYNSQCDLIYDESFRFDEKVILKNEFEYDQFGNVKLSRRYSRSIDTKKYFLAEEISKEYEY